MTSASTLRSYLDFKQRFGKYEKGIFDGVSVKLSKAVGRGNVFMVDNWVQVTQEARDAEMKLAASLPVSNTIPDNFLVLFGASQMDWFSDEDWAKVDNTCAMQPDWPRQPILKEFCGMQNPINREKIPGGWQIRKK